MRDGLKKRIQGKNPKTLSTVTTSYLKKNSYNRKIPNISCVSKSCDKPIRDLSGNYIGKRQENKALQRPYYAPFRQPLNGWRKSLNHISNNLQSPDPCLEYTEVYKDTYSTCGVDCNTYGSLPTTSTPGNSVGGWGQVPSNSGISVRASKPLIRSGMQPNSAGQQNSGKPNEIQGNSKRYSYSYRELLNNRKKVTYSKKLETQQSSQSNNLTNGYGGSCCLEKNSTNKGVVVYKPNNSNYGVQGAVESSTRLERLKLNTIRGARRCIAPLQTGPSNSRSDCNGVYFAGKPREEMGPSGSSYTQRKYKNMFNQNNREVNNPQVSALARARGASSRRNTNNNTTCCN